MPKGPQGKPYFQYLLTGFIECALCGTRVSGVKANEVALGITAAEPPIPLLSNLQRATRLAFRRIHLKRSFGTMFQPYSQILY